MSVYLHVCVYNVYEYNIIQKTKIHKYFHIHLQENILEVKFLAKKNAFVFLKGFAKFP